jgi:predicted HD superfamily hydrolase involved in NAD metabolism
MGVMEELAGVYPLSREQARLTGLLHDAAKDMEREHQMALAEEAGIEFRHPCERDPFYLHGPVGAYVASTRLGVDDPVILSAISMHTFCGQEGSELDFPLLWCLRFADLLEPTRGEWTRKSELRELAYTGQMEEAALFETRLILGWFEENGTPVHPNIVEACKHLSTRLEVNQLEC